MEQHSSFLFKRATELSRRMSQLESQANSSYFQTHVPLHFRDLEALELAVINTRALLTALNEAVATEKSYRQTVDMATRKEPK